MKFFRDWWRMTHPTETPLEKFDREYKEDSKRQRQERGLE